MNDKIHICYSETINIYTVRIHSIILKDFNAFKDRVFTRSLDHFRPFSDGFSI